jgi:hypothetical protein
MLFGKDNVTYVEHADVLMNILGTRVQMGHVSISLASRLVSNGYAHLAGFRGRSNKQDDKQDGKLKYDDDVAHLCFLPDPVCAHLAMCLMDKDCTLGENIYGREPKFWTDTARELFSSGICHPSKGDVGEVAAALYLLFCGDAARKELDDNKKYMKFSIDLCAYVEKLTTSNSQQAATAFMMEEAKPAKGGASSKCSYQVNFIQFTRQTFHISFQNLCHQSVLEMLYKSANALYLPTNTAVFDMLASIKCVDTMGKIEYIPLAASVKSRRTFGPKELDEELERMETEMSNAKIERALCLVILLDLKNSGTSAVIENSLDIGNLSKLDDSIACKVLFVKNDDCFGIGTLIQNT